MRPPPRDYNGFSMKERIALSKAQEQEKRRYGPWFRRECLMCGLTYEDDGACVIGHLEDYRDPILGVLPLCVECHERIHRRFAQPRLWVDYLLRLRGGFKPPAWKTFMAFRAAGGPAGDRDLPRAQAFTPDPARWWETLLLRPIHYLRDPLPKIVLPEPVLLYPDKPHAPTPPMPGGGQLTLL